MKNKTAIIVTALLCLCTVIFATEKVQEPGKNQVLLVGKVSLLKDLDRDFYIQTLGLDPSLRDKNHTYGFLPDPKRDDILTVPIDTVIGDYFFIPVKIPKTGRFPLQGFFVFLFPKVKKGPVLSENYILPERVVSTYPSAWTCLFRPKTDTYTSEAIRTALRETTLSWTA